MNALVVMLLLTVIISFFYLHSLAEAVEKRTENVGLLIRRAARNAIVVAIDKGKGKIGQVTLHLPAVDSATK